MKIENLKKATNLDKQLEYVDKRITDVTKSFECRLSDINGTFSVNALGLVDGTRVVVEVRDIFLKALGEQRQKLVSQIEALD